MKYKGETCNVSIYYNRKLGQFNKKSLDQVIDIGAVEVVQANANLLPSKPELVLWDADGMRLVYFDKNGNTKVTPYFIHK